MINKSYIVCSTGRSGSTLLCSTLLNLGCCGKPAEYLHSAKIEKYIDKGDTKGFQDYLSQILHQETGKNGIFGIKIHWEHFRNFLNLARKYLGFRDKSDWEIISTIFPNPYFIYIWRRNLVKQAVSTEIAYQTQQWVKSNQNITAETPKRLIFKPLNIYRYKQGLQARNDRWRKFFAQNCVDFYEIVYEDFVLSFENTIRDLVDFIEVDSLSDSYEIKMPTYRQSSDINERWCQYYSYIPENLLKLYGGFRTEIKKLKL